MVNRASAEARETYLVEHYRPGRTVEELQEWAVRVRDTVVELEGEGLAIRFVHSAIVPRDEALLCTLEAAGEELVHEAYSRAGLPFERLSAVIPTEGGGR